MRSRLPNLQLGVSLGCPAGIGPDVLVRALVEHPNREITVFGDQGVLERAATRLGLTIPAATKIVPVTSLNLDEVQPGQPSEISGRAQLDYLEAATTAVLKGEVAALVTGPMSRDWAARAGIDVSKGTRTGSHSLPPCSASGEAGRLHTPFNSQMEYLADRAGVREYAAMQIGRKLRVTVVTSHVSFRSVPALLSVQAIASATILTARALHTDFGIALPRVAVAGLNPHAGDGGRLGEEDARLVLPAVDQAQRRLSALGLAARVSGPHEPDAVFRQAYVGEFDAVVALYHDQGQIPIKLLHFDEAVSFTLGLPFVRTSPDHGTAYDIAGTGRGRHQSFLAALDLASDLVEKNLRANA
jgi:4-hydroxythreonine-4-phosphate dehydrogenase